jgi:hypothetical protein
MASLLTSPPPIALGARVQVFCRFDGEWVSGFAVTGYVDGDARSLRVKRLSDGCELPGRFALADVRPDSRPSNATR